MLPTFPEVGLWASLACLWEATALKAGNVHRERGFPTLSYVDFLQSAAALVALSFFSDAPTGGLRFLAE